MVISPRQVGRSDIVVGNNGGCLGSGDGCVTVIAIAGQADERRKNEGSFTCPIRPGPVVLPDRLGPSETSTAPQLAAVNYIDVKPDIVVPVKNLAQFDETSPVQRQHADQHLQSGRGRGGGPLGQRGAVAWRRKDGHTVRLGLGHVAARERPPADQRLHGPPACGGGRQGQTGAPAPHGPLDDCEH